MARPARGSGDVHINVTSDTLTGDNLPLLHSIDPDYTLPTLGTRAGVLKALRAIGDATIHRMLDPKQCTAIAYLLQVARSVQQDAEPRKQQQPLKAQKKRAK